MNRIDIQIDGVRYDGDDMDRLSEIRLGILIDGRSVNLLKRRWDATPVVNWLQENSRAIRDDALPQPFENYGGSIAERARIALDLVDPFDDVAVDNIYSYLHRHSVALAFSGTPVPDIIIGVGPTGGEISCFDDDITWSYPVDLSDFPSYVDALAAKLLGTLN